MKNLRVVLVSSKYPRNIGLVSRILSNFGVEQLILVTPQCELTEEAKQGAAQGQAALANCKIYQTWNEFHSSEPNGLRIGFSRRQGKRRASEPLETLLKHPIIDMGKPIYLIFGAEDHGLSSDDLDMVHRMAYFDLPGPLQSMNLSHSVLVAIQSFFHHFGTHQDSPHDESTEDPEGFLKEWLEALNFDLESQRRWNALTMLKQLILKANPTSDEMHKLEMIIQHTIRKIKKS